MVQSNVCVVTMGDIGRSPRMTYHSLSLAEEGHKVDIISYKGVEPLRKLSEQHLVSFHYLSPYPENLPLPKSINYVFKAIWQAVTLFFVLMIIRKPNFILVQNPPAVPTLLVCYVSKILLGCQLIIDWHNYAYTIMAVSCGSESVLVRFTKFMEKFFGQKADFNLCVTNAMRKNLKTVWQIEAITLYDRPPAQFRPISLEEHHDIIKKLGAHYPVLINNSEIEDETVFTKKIGDEVFLKETRPGLLVSSTSWTPDEDFGVLLNALQEYENIKNTVSMYNLPKLICIITGKGPMKDYYCKLIEERDWKHVTVITPWLEANDYPFILGSADLGVCLHTSSSGLDLPMKVVDMFGCCLPVCAHNFECIDELVKHGYNGYVFDTKEELTQRLIQWFCNYPKDETQNEVKERFKIKLDEFQSLRWHKNWKETIGNIFN